MEETFSVDIEPKRKACCIVGYAPGRENAPFDDEEVEIWGMNDLWAHWPPTDLRIRWDRWYDLHKRHVIIRNARTGPVHLEWLKKFEGPIYTLEELEELPSAKAFPLEEVVAQLGATESPYFTSSPAYMLAHAVYEGYNEVHIYGVNLLGDGEYEYQRPCMDFWIGFARGRGVNVIIPPDSALVRSRYRYGYDTHGGDGDSVFIDLCRSKMIEYEQARAQHEQQVMRIMGAMEAMGWAKDMSSHIARGGFVPTPENLVPEGAHAQQKREQGQALYMMFREALANAKPDDMASQQRVADLAAQILRVPDGNAPPIPNTGDPKA